MQTNSTTSLITFDEFEAIRTRPCNEEHCEAFMKERYQIALQLVLIHGNRLSAAARESFPLITDKDYSLPRTRTWSLDFMDWREGLSKADRRKFDAITFLPR